MTLESGTGSACAACKYQRRRCTPTCVLAPYFPADQPKNFQDAHKLFGVRKIVKLLKMLDDSQKADAMNSIIYQAYIRDRYPVHGCLGVILHLNYQIWQKEEELHAVQSQLDMYRHQHQQPHPNLTEEVPSQLQLGQAPPSNNSNGLTLFTSPHDNPNPRNYNDNPVGALPISHQHSYSNSSNNIGYGSTFLDSKDSVGSSNLWAHHHHHPCITNHNTNSMVMQSQLVAPQPMTIQQQQVVQDYDEMHPFFDTLDDRQSYIDSKEAYESSSDESLKYTRQSVERVAENELKNAAACFSLTSVNYQ